MEFLYSLHESMTEQQLALVYKGEINQQITKAFSSMAEKKLDEINEDISVKRRVYHVMVECLQNIYKYAVDAETGKPTKMAEGILMVGKSDNGYFITFGNPIANKKVEELKN